MAREMLKKVVIDSNKCVGCGACIAACPEQAIRMKPGWLSHVLQEKCVGCGTCVALCHRGAPQLVGEEKEP